MYIVTLVYTAREVATVLGIKPGRLKVYLKDGIIMPSKGEGGEDRYSFQDLALLRKAEGLVLQRIPAKRVHKALRQLRQRMGARASLSGVQLEAEGHEVVATDGGRRWEPASGQFLMSFGSTTNQADAPKGALAPVHELRRKTKATPPDEQTAGLSEDEIFERAVALETTDLDQAVALYRQVVERAPGHADAHVNLGRLLHERNDAFGALVHYRAAIAIRPQDATATFNLGVALEDLDRAGEAMDAYGRALELDDRNADAHYNMARLLEQAGRSDVAVRHLLLYRQLTRKPRG